MEVRIMRHSVGVARHASKGTTIFRTGIVVLMAAAFGLVATQVSAGNDERRGLHAGQVCGPPSARVPVDSSQHEGAHSGGSEPAAAVPLTDQFQPGHIPTSATTCP